MVVGFLRSSSSSSSSDESCAPHMMQPQHMQAPAQTMAMHHHHLQLQSSLAAPPLSSLRTSSSGNHAVKRPFQELPRLHVPSHALAQQAQPMWKTGSVIMPSSLGIVSGGSPPPPPPAAPRFQFFTNTVGGWFGRNSAPAKTLPSFHEVLARTNQLQIVGQDDPENNAQQHQQQQVQMQPPQQQTAAADIDMLNAQKQQLMEQQMEQQQQQAQQEQIHHQLQHMQLQQQQFQQQQQQQQLQLHEQHQQQMEQHQQQALAMQFPPTAAPPSYTAFAPQTILMQANEMLAQRPSLSVVNSGSGATEAPSPMSLTSPAASQTGDASKRRERWTEDEHARFMEGLNRYGRKWKKIQTFVQTKTAVQVRTHAYGYFAKLLRNMPEDDGVWELAEEMSSLPGAVLKGPGNGKRRNEPKTDEQGMDVLRRFVFSKKKSDDKKASTEGDGSSDKTDGSDSQQQQQQEAPYANWSIVEDSAASSAMLELKRQRIM